MWTNNQVLQSVPKQVCLASQPPWHIRPVFQTTTTDTHHRSWVGVVPKSQVALIQKSQKSPWKVHHPSKQTINKKNQPAMGKSITYDIKKKTLANIKIQANIYVKSNFLSYPNHKLFWLYQVISHIKIPSNKNQTNHHHRSILWWWWEFFNLAPKAETEKRLFCPGVCFCGGPKRLVGDGDFFDDFFWFFWFFWFDLFCCKYPYFCCCFFFHVWCWCQYVSMICMSVCQYDMYVFFFVSRLISYDCPLVVPCQVWHVASITQKETQKKNTWRMRPAGLQVMQSMSYWWLRYLGIWAWDDSEDPKRKQNTPWNGKRNVDIEWNPQQTVFQPFMFRC